MEHEPIRRGEDAKVHDGRISFVTHSQASREPTIDHELQRISITDAHTMKESTL